jgi:RNA polymerase sigma factor (sigma-70 family)
MTAARADTLLRHLHTLLRGRAAEASDADLLRRFAAARDEAAFEALVRRHGPMVLGVCRRILRHTHDAEDAFQAAFLVLARKAASIRRRGSVGSWLYGVAYRLARKALTRRESRRTVPAVGDGRGVIADPSDDLTWRELRGLLDEELSRLPESYRMPLLLCYLEGLTQDEAARRLGWNPRTLKARLARGRDALRGRLARRGLPLGAALVGPLLAREAQALPPALAAAAVRSASGSVTPGAAALAGALLRDTSLARLKVVAALVVMAGALAAGSGALWAPAPEQSVAPPADEKPAAAASQPTRPVDRQGDALPPGALVRFGTERLRHGHAVTAVAFSPDGTLVASSSGFFDMSVVLWDAATGKEVRRLGGDVGWVFALAFSPDGKALATGDRAGTVRICDVSTGRELSSFRAHDVEVHALAYSPDGKSLASCADGTLALWDPATGREVQQFRRDEGGFRSLAFSPEGKRLAAAAMDGTLVVWDVATGKPLLEGNPSERPVLSVAFAPDGKALATGGPQGQVCLWDARTGQETRSLKGHEQGHQRGVLAVAFSPDGKTLASAANDQTLRLWDVETGKVRHVCRGHVAPVHCLAFAPDGKTIATGAADKDNSVRLWDVATGKERAALEGHVGWVGFLALSADGKQLLTGCADHTLRRWDAATGQPLLRIDGPQPRAKAVAVSADGKLVAAGGIDHKVSLWEAETGKPLRTLEGHEGGVRTVAFFPDGRHLISEGGPDGTARVWDVTTGKEVRRLAEHPDDFMSAFAFSADGKTLFTGAEQGAVRIWDAAEGKPLRVLEGHAAAIEGLAVSPDGRLLASASDDRTVRLWDIATGRELRRFNPQGMVYGVAFSPDGRMLAAACGTGQVHLWEVASGEERLRLRAHHGAAASVQFAPDGRTLYTGGSDGTALAWSLPALARPQPSPPSPRLESEWVDLTGPDAAKAYAAVWAVAAAPKEALVLLGDVLKPAAAADDKRLRKLIGDLDADDFAVRETATAELEQAGEQAEPALRRALAGKPSAELRRRVEFLLEKQGDTSASPERLRQMRALEALEHTDAPEGRDFLRRLAQGAPEAWLTKEARAALARLGRIH